MNIFANGTTESSQMEDVMSAVKSETKKGNVNGTRGSPDGNIYGFDGKTKTLYAMYNGYRWYVKLVIIRIVVIIVI